MNTATTKRSRKPRLNKKGLILAASTGAVASLGISVQQGGVGKPEIVRASVSALIAALAFLQSPTFPPASPPDR